MHSAINKIIKKEKSELKDLKNLKKADIKMDKKMDKCKKKMK
jgi:hypothetical protein